MKRLISIVLLLAGLVLPGCKTIELRSNLFIDLPVSALELSRETSPSSYSLETLALSPEYMIDDFETGPGLWSIHASTGSQALLTEIPAGKLRAVRLHYQLPRRRFRGLDPDQALMRILKDETAFERYAGIQFTARSMDRIPLRVILFEYNRISDKLSAREYWVREVDLTPEWRVYRLVFNDFAPEEYYEQGYVGDEHMDLPRIREVGFCVRNLRLLPDDSGEVDIDDVQLF